MRLFLIAAGVVTRMTTPPPIAIPTSILGFSAHPSPMSAAPMAARSSPCSPTDTPSDPIPMSALAQNPLRSWPLAVAGSIQQSATTAAIASQHRPFKLNLIPLLTPAASSSNRVSRHGDHEESGHGDHEDHGVEKRRRSFIPPFVISVLFVAQNLRVLRGPTSQFPPWLEVDLRCQLEEAGRQNRRRRQPRAVEDEGLIVGLHRARVQCVVEIDAELRPQAAEPHQLPDSQIDLIDPVAVDLTGRDEIHRRRLRVAR